MEAGAGGADSGESKKVASSCFELLHMEMVEYFSRQAEQDEQALHGGKADPAVVEKKVKTKLQMLGYTVGHRLAERYTKDVQRLNHPPDGQLRIIKFICKEFWQLVFRKPAVDKLSTNFRGIYQLVDHRFSWIAKISGTPQQRKPYVAFASGVIKGALANLGVKVSVEVEVSANSACTFRIVDISQARRISSRSAKS